MILVISDRYNTNKLLKNILDSLEIQIDEIEYNENDLNEIEIFKDYKLILLNIQITNSDLIAIESIKKKLNVPIILLNSSPNDKLTPYINIIDAFVEKPFSINLLISIINKFYKKISISRSYDSLKLIKDSRTILVNNIEVFCSAKEREILFYLEENKGIIKSRDEILSNIWGDKFKGDTRVVDKQIAKLRKALGESGKYIKTIKLAGYMFEYKIK